MDTITANNLDTTEQEIITVMKASGPDTARLMNADAIIAEALYGPDSLGDQELSDEQCAPYDSALESLESKGLLESREAFGMQVYFLTAAAR